MADVGLRISATENVSSIGPKVVDSLRSIAQAGEEIQKTLDLGDIEEQYKRFAEREERIFDQQRARQGEIRQAPPPVPGGRAVGAAVPAGITAALRTGGRTVQTLGAGGDVLAAAPDVLGTLGEVTKAIPGWGKIAAGIIGVAGGIVFAGNALAKQYEKVMEPIMDLTASLGRLGETSEEVSRNFGRTMEEVGDKAAEFGMDLEKGMAIYGTLARAGVTGEALGPAAGDIMGYARGYGVGTEPLARYMGMGLRFGQQGNLLGMAAGGLQAAGMGRGQYEEYLQATLSIFEEGLSKGVVKGFEDINLMQTWMAELGDAFKGQYGVGLYQQMSSAFAGATALQREGDVLLYRGAMRALRAEEKPAGVLDIMERMERGPTGTIMEETIGLIRQMTGGKEFDAVQMIKEAFGVNTIIARKLWGMREGEGAGERMLEELGPGWKPIEGTPEIRLLKTQKEIMGQIRDSGKALLPIKESVVSGAENILKIANKYLGVGEEGEVKRERKVSLEPLVGLMATGAQGRSGTPLPAHILTAADELTKTIMGEAERGSRPALGILDFINKGGLTGLDPEKLVDFMVSKGPMSPESKRGVWVDKGELGAFLAALKIITENMDKTIDKAGRLEINVETKETQPSQATGYPEGSRGPRE